MTDFLQTLITGIFQLIEWILKGFFVFLRFLFHIDSQKLYNNRLLNRREKNQFLKRKYKGLSLTGENKRMSLEDSFKNITILGTTGAGKTNISLIPNLLRKSGFQSFFIFDPSGEIHRNTSGYLSKELNYEIRILNFSDTENSLCYNALEYAGDDPAKLRQVASNLIESVFPNASPNQKFWNASSEDLLTVLFRLLATQPKECRHLGAALNLLQQMQRDIKAVNAFVAANADEPLYLDYIGCIKASENTFLSVLQTARVALKSIKTEPQLEKLLSQNTIGFEECREKRIVYFISVNEGKLRTIYSGIVSVFFTQVMDFLVSSPLGSNPVSVILDEVAALSLSSLADIIVISRKRSISFMLLCQNFNQLVHRYGKERAHSLVYGGCSTMVLLGSQPLDMARQIEGIVGKEQVTIKDNEGRKKEHIRPVLDVGMVTGLKKNTGIVIHVNQKPLLARMFPFYEQRKLLKRSKIPPTPFPRSNIEEVKYVSLNTESSHD